MYESMLDHIMAFDIRQPVDPVRLLTILTQTESAYFDIKWSSHKLDFDRLNQSWAVRNKLPIFKTVKSSRSLRNSEPQS